MRTTVLHEEAGSYTHCTLCPRPTLEEGVKGRHARRLCKSCFKMWADDKGKLPEWLIKFCSFSATQANREIKTVRAEEGIRHDAETRRY